MGVQGGKGRAHRAERHQYPPESLFLGIFLIARYSDGVFALGSFRGLGRVCTIVKRDG